MTRLLKPQFTSAFYHVLWSGLDLLFPPRCAGCGCPGFRWCPQCAASIQHPPEPVCRICGIPIQGEAGLCVNCRAEKPAYSVLRSWAVFDGPIRSALHRLKYRRDVALGDALVPQLAEYVVGLQWPVDLVVPVPLGKKRLSERGYNQVGLIARPLSVTMRLAYAPGAIFRDRETRSQVGLTRAQRQENVRNAFRAIRSRVKRGVVLLIDDVATTGSTLSSCARALFEAGAQDVFAFTVCRAIPRQGLRHE